jgi:YidC/Oxa1 family membrane protein insertase
MDKTQRTMMMILPVAFVPVIVRFPVGLVIYWVTTNLWTVGQGIVTRQMMPKPQPPPKRSSRTPRKSDKPSSDGAAEATEDKSPAQPSQPRRVRRKKKKARR